MKKIFVFALVAVLLAALVIPQVMASSATDIYIKEKIHTDAVKIFGRTISEAEDTYTETWMSGDKMRVDNYDEQYRLTDSTIWRGDKGKVYFVDHVNKTYTEMNLGEVTTGMPTGMAMNFTVKVTPTSETKMIKTWNCKKYMVETNIAMGIVSTTTTQEIWTTEDIKIDYSQYMQFSQSAQSGAGLSISEDVIKEWAKVKGYPVLTITTIKTMGQSIKSTTELLEYNSQKSAPAGTYDIPKGYTKVTS